MKRLLTLVIMAVLCLVSCSKEAQIIGSWECESIQVKSMGTTVDINLAEQGMIFTLTFKDGGVLETKMSVSGETSTDTSTYTITEDNLVIDGDPIPYELKGKKLVMYGGGDLMEMDGEFTMTFVRM